MASFKILDKCFRLGTFCIGFDCPLQALLLLCPSFGLPELSAEFCKLLSYPNTSLVMFVVVKFLNKKKLQTGFWHPRCSDACVRLVA
jgi:hypothetical protein